MITTRHLLPIMFMLIFSACKEQANHTTATEEVKPEIQAWEGETDSDYQAISLLGDTLVSLDGQPVPHHDALVALLSGDRVGIEVPARIVRAGKLDELTVEIGEKK